MRIRPFEYHAAENLPDALDMAARWGSDAKILAGGTDLVVAMKHKTMLPPHLISLHKVKELEFVQVDDSSIHVGALCRHADLAVHSALKKSIPVLCEAVNLIGSWQIRNMATIGGNICHASPAADSAAPLLVLDARAVITGSGGERTVPLESFFVGPGVTSLKPNEIVKELTMAKPKGQSFGCYKKLMRKKAVDLSQVGVAFQAEVDEGREKLSKVAIGLGGVAPTPIRVPEAEQLFAGRSYDQAMKAIPEAARAAVAATRPIDDIRATASYRREIVAVYLQRAAEEVFTSLFNGKGN